MNIKSKRTAQEILDCLIASCEEGKSGEWDASVPTGESGFQAMIEQLEDLKEFVEYLQER